MGTTAPHRRKSVAAWAPGESVVRQVFTLDGAERLAVATCAMPETVRVRMVCDAESPLALHWGVAWRFRHERQLPPESFRPAGTSLFDGQAAHTPFTERDGLQYLELEFRKPAQGPGPRGMKFVLYQPDGAAWLKSGGKEVYCPLFEREGDPRLPSPRLWDLADQIVGAEKGASSWTLMHRFNLCHDLLEGVEDDEEALALLFAWLRYGATRSSTGSGATTPNPANSVAPRSGSPSGWPASGDGNRRATPWHRGRRSDVGAPPAHDAWPRGRRPAGP